MKVLLIYFSMGGRTEKVSKIIAQYLGDNVDIESFNYPKKIWDFLGEQEEIMKGDLSSFAFNEKILNLEHYDVIIFGTPTYGSRPAAVFNGFLERASNLDGKKFVVFNTYRFYSGKTLERMEEAIKEKGASVVSKNKFRGFFRIKSSKAEEYGQKLNEQLKNME